MMKWLYLAATPLISQKDSGIPDASHFSLTAILNAVYFWAGAVAVIVIIVAGFMYVLSSNNAQQVTRAKNAILSAVIGLVIILLAFGITNIAIKAVS